MSEFYYVIDDQNGVRLHLCGDGLRRYSSDRTAQLKDNGFRHVEDRSIGSCVLHVFERTMPATDIVPTGRTKIGA